MTTQPEDLRYTEDHEWLRKAPDGTVFVGITEHAQAQLGDLVFVQLPAIGARYAVGDEMAVIESVKAAGDIKAPLAGTVVAVNAALVEDPSKANTDPMVEGWFVRLQPDEPAALDQLLTAEAYTQLLREQG